MPKGRKKGFSVGQKITRDKKSEEAFVRKVKRQGRERRTRLRRTLRKP